MKGRDLLSVLEVYDCVLQEQKVSCKTNSLKRNLFKSNEKDENIKDTFDFDNIITRNAEMLELIERVKKISSSSSPVLIYGETGTGKELLVRAIHNHSIRSKGPFIAQNCAAIPASLFESILFGTVKGAFTGAENKPGLIELADGGTLYLDELNSMPINLQAKLLRAIQFNEIRRLGANKAITTNARIIASTNIEPKIEIQNKQLREDLYYRLNVLEFHIPPLRDRLDDIEVLVDHFVGKYNVKLNKNIEEIDENIYRALKKHKWEGNVRELENIIERVMNFIAPEKRILNIKDIESNLKEDILLMNKDIMFTKSEKDIDILPLNKTLARIESSLIAQALEKTNGNISQAARELKIPRQTLQNKLRKQKSNTIS